MPVKVAETVVKQKVNYDSMWIKAQFPSGASYKFHVNRNRESLELAFSNNKEEAKVQAKVFLDWINKTRDEMNWGDLFNVLEAKTKSCNSGKELINLLK